ncbi:hypothetical protein E3O42_16715 [Cryobacterium adonitolivorans]|uniref:DUF3558 domain-containing protein n=1 Tax=Cryobacterium adonitolivorans TaxID=1259189 RepID=A0A4R8VYD5_9MICO|nr:hypothetical protein [Cryobacterium adonitolivorans]TFB96780.1 hypothetical protein E3O42_16715 [Cryobacterium adonitolivorans]
MGAAPTPAPPPAKRRLWVIIGVLAAVLAVSAILVGVFWPRGGVNPVATEAARPTPSATVAPTTPVPGTGAGATPAPGSSAAPGTPQPASCDDLYSAEMVAAFGRMELNPAWLDELDNDMKIGEDDPVQQGVIDANDSLLCQWGMPEGPSGAGVSTVVVWVDAEDSATIQAHLADRGDSCSEQQGGLRCTTEGSNDEGYFGESHFLRDGIWVATEYSNAGPEGYTLDIVNNLWPEG